MTTWQDETPTSRRALRERERARSQAPADAGPQNSDFSAVSPPRLQPGQAPSYRVRDYSPDARGTQFSTVGGPGAAQVAGHSYAAPVAPAPVAPAPVIPEPVVEHTLTRRELRILREGAEAAANPGPPPAPPELVDPLEPRTQSAPQAAPAPASVPVPASVPASYVDQSAHVYVREPEPAPDVVFVPEGAFAPPAPEFELATDYAPPVAHVSPAPAPVVPVDQAPFPDGRVRPEGHWSRQADLDDRTQRGDVLPGRDLSRSDAITTSALVLPSMPQNPIGALSSTGEILVTGSIDLPRMLGATGIHPARYDNSDFDSTVDAGDGENSHPNSSPVRAIRAVSAHTSTQGIMAAKRPRSKVPTILLAGFASVMGIGVVVLFVGGMLLDLF